MSPQDYETAVALLDHGTRVNAAACKDLGQGRWTALLTPVQHAELALRLAQALAAEARA